MKFPPLLTGLGLFLIGCSLLRAQAPLVEDTFKNASADSTALVTSVLAWKKIANVTMGLTSASQPGSSALQVDFLAYGKFYAVFPSVPLTVGSTLEATLLVRYAADPGPMNAGLRLGFENLTDSENPANTDAQPGYLMFTDPGQSSPKGGSFAVEDGTDGGLGGGKDFRGFGLPFPSIAFGTEIHTLTFTVSKTDAGNEVSFKCDDGEAATAVDTSVQPAAFNTLLVSVGNIPSASLIIEKATIRVVPAPKP
ncbi:hypothetical protein BH09VER1_BH09VER1_27590 [soil metagenome]